MTTTSGEVQLDGLAVDCGFCPGGDVELNSAGVDCSFSAGAEIELAPLEIDSYFQTCGEVILPALNVWTTPLEGGAVANIQLPPILANHGVFASGIRLPKLVITSQTGWLSGEEEDNQLSIEVEAYAQDHQEYNSEIELNSIGVEGLCGSIADSINLGNVAVSATGYDSTDIYAPLVALGKMLVSSRVSTQKRTIAGIKLGKMSVSSRFSGWNISAGISLRRMTVRSFMETVNDLLAGILLPTMVCDAWAWAEDVEGLTADFSLPDMSVMAKTKSTLADWYYLQYEAQRVVSGMRFSDPDGDDGYYILEHKRND